MNTPYVPRIKNYYCLLKAAHELLFKQDLFKLAAQVYGDDLRNVNMEQLHLALVDRYETELFDVTPPLKNSELQTQLLHGKLACAYDYLGMRSEAAHLHERSRATPFPGASAGFWSLMGVEH